jgi:hypothetical protein
MGVEANLVAAPIRGLFFGRSTMRSFILTCVVGLTCLGLLGAIPTDARAQTWVTSYPTYTTYSYPGYSYYYYPGYTTYYATPAYTTYYSAPAYTYYTPGYTSYYYTPGYATYYSAPVYRGYYGLGYPAWGYYRWR